MEAPSVWEPGEAAGDVGIHAGIPVEKEAPEAAPEPKQGEVKAAEQWGGGGGKVQEGGDTAGTEEAENLSERLVKIGGVAECVTAGDEILARIGEPGVVHVSFDKLYRRGSQSPCEIDHLRGEIESNHLSIRIAFMKGAGDVSGAAGDIENRCGLCQGELTQHPSFPCGIPSEGERTGDEVITGSHLPEKITVIASLAVGIKQGLVCIRE
jgi:hypothetical protein